MSTVFGVALGVALGLAGVAGIVWLLMAATLVLTVVLAGALYNVWCENRRLDRLAEQLARLEFDRLSPIDWLEARDRWPALVDRAGRHGDLLKEQRALRAVDAEFEELRRQVQ